MPGDRPDLRRLAAAVGGRLAGPGDVTVSDVTHDSREVGPGVLFVAIKGESRDGHEFVPQAVEAGAAAVCVEDEAGVDSPAIVVDDSRWAMAILADAVHGHPSGHLRLVGVTGTNGKTTVTHLLEQICVAAAIPEAIVGTVGARIRGVPVAVERTTPESTDFQRLLVSMVDAGVDVGAVEVSSHALALHRVGATEFEVAAFTNLSQDHLDFHRDMAEYEAVKATLFSQARRAVIWADDPAGRRIAASLEAPLLVGTSEEAQVHVDPKALGFGGSEFLLTHPGGSMLLSTRLAGRFNIANAAIAAACALELEIGADAISAGIAALARVPGRFELVDTGRECTVVVDYAHTPDAVNAAIATAKEIVGDGGRVIAVVGAAGDRDRAKRPLMGRAATTADVAVLTSDNPRSEDPASILAEVGSGADHGGRVILEIDRRRAIGRALAEAGGDDVVLILGKGHEQNQEFVDALVPFDDRVVAREEAAAL